MKSNITLLAALLILPAAGKAAVVDYYYSLTGNSYYAYSYNDINGNYITDTSPLTGFLHVSVDDVSNSIALDYSNVLLGGNPFRSNETLLTTAFSIYDTSFVSGTTGDPDYQDYGNATLSPTPFLCVECGYEMTLDLTALPYGSSTRVLAYFESNPFDTGVTNFELFVSQVPLPATVWLFGSGLIGLAGLARRKRSC